MNTRKGVSGILGSGLLLAAIVACATTADAAVEIRWQPVSATGNYTITDNEGTPWVASEILLEEGVAQQVTLEFRVSGWGTAAGSPTLGAYQGRLDAAASYSNGYGADIGPLNPLTEDGCFIDTNRTDFVYYGESPLAAVFVADLQYVWGSTCMGDFPVDGGGAYYGGTFIIDVPADAAGRYTITWDSDSEWTFMNDDSANLIPGLIRTPAVIKVPPLCDLSAANITDVFPPNCHVDARQPHDIYDTAVSYGWDELVLTLQCDPTDITDATASDFTVSVTPFELSPPVIDTVDLDSVNNTVTITLDRIISTDHWTCIEHTPTGGEWCMGYLPGDAGNDGKSNTLDINSLVSSLNSPGTSPEYSTDINRSGATNAQDILRVIDLLNGAGDFDAWSGKSMDRNLCPSR